MHGLDWYRHRKHKHKIARHPSDLTDDDGARNARMFPSVRHSDGYAQTACARKGVVQKHIIIDNCGFVLGTFVCTADIQTPPFTK
jgi:hypothetical protein